jgi:hypothetical protein
MLLACMRFDYGRATAQPDVFHGVFDSTEKGMHCLSLPCEFMLETWDCLIFISGEAC